MKRGGKLEIVVNLSRQRSLQFLVGVGFLYLLLVSVEFPFVYRRGFSAMSEGWNIKVGGGGVVGDAVNRRVQLESQENLAAKETSIQPLTLPLIIPPPPQAPNEENLVAEEAPIRSLSMPLRMPPPPQAPTEQNLAVKEATPPPPQASVQAPNKKKTTTTQKKTPTIPEHELVSISLFDDNSFNSSGSDAGAFKFQKTAKASCKLGKQVWDQLRSGKVPVDSETSESNWNGAKYCPRSIMVSGSDFSDAGRIMKIPCGLALGSNFALVGKPRAAHPERDPKIALVRRGETLMVSQFMLELQGSKAADGEEPPKILHFNPRLKGDWSRKPVIELNTCYRMQWGSAARCDGWRSRDDEETVDGQVKCERWIRDDGDHSVDSIGTSWLNKLTGKKKEDFSWPYPFVEDKHFVLSLSAGLEGYHVNVDGRHITSFPYHTGFSLEDATVLYVNGDVDIHSIFAAALPTSRQSFDRQMHLEMSTKWQAPPLRNGSVELFVGILSAGHHFAERMAVRKSWLQHRLVKSSTVVARFFVALHATMAINVELKEEAEFFGDIVIVPYMDNYDLVVLKTVAIFQYGVQKFGARHIMKCDDDTFVRPDAILRDIKGVAGGRSLYLGNINYHHKPLRRGKWSVTHEEWPEEDYPPYADGAGYVLSSDIARFVVSEFQKHSLRWFKMEDVSVGMWVEQFSRSRKVEYIHRLSFCQFGCIKNYYTAHYQSPRQMMCLWKKLQEGRPECCNMR